MSSALFISLVCIIIPMDTTMRRLSNISGGKRWCSSLRMKNIGSKLVKGVVSLKGNIVFISTKKSKHGEQWPKKRSIEMRLGFDWGRRYGWGMSRSHTTLSKSIISMHIQDIPDKSLQLKKNIIQKSGRLISEKDGGRNRTNKNWFTTHGLSNVKRRRRRDSKQTPRPMTSRIKSKRTTLLVLMK